MWAVREDLRANSCVKMDLTPIDATSIPTADSADFTKQKNLILDKDIVCASKWLHFPTGSLDLFLRGVGYVVADFQSFFLEINRVLKRDGTFVLIKPSITLRS
jgi:SAM-dependent methyltransferase